MKKFKVTSYELLASTSSASITNKFQPKLDLGAQAPRDRGGLDVDDGQSGVN